MEKLLNFKEVFGPQTAYPYFQHQQMHPFRYASQRFEIVNAGWCADASLLVYINDPDFVAKTWKDRAGLEAECVGFDRTGPHGTQYVVAHNMDFILVSFRGTEIKEKEDILTDAKWIPVDSGQGGDVHQGFKDALDSVWDGLLHSLQKLQSGRTVWFTGHSLGAGLATLAADRYAPTQGLYTFGSPRVGDESFKKDFHVNAYRFVNNNDIVTRVPPPGLYSHVGRLLYIDSQGIIHDNPKWERNRTGSLPRYLIASH